jgi:Ca-activated chloride channel family protein
MILHLLYFHIIYILIPILLCAAFYRMIWRKSSYYVYPLSKDLAASQQTHRCYHKKILAAIRFSTLFGLIFLIARPVWVDERSKVNVDGIDIVLAIDVSDSMNIFDDLRDRRTRIEVAKQEAIRFIEKRVDDPIGIVIFGKDVLSRCPLTLDKSILKEIVGTIEIGTINPQGTWLGTGLATAIGRLRTSKAKSKVIVLLTDGEPTPPEKVEPDSAIDLAKRFGIKVYTIGIGNEQGGYFTHPIFGVQQIPYTLNVSLLKKIAQETGGLFLRANKPSEIRAAYDTINKLEKTNYQTTLFHHYYEAFLTFIWFILCLLAFELILRLFIWRGV